MAANHYSSFIDAVAKKRREAGLWTSIVVQVASNQNEPIAPFEQIAQVLEFEFKGHEILIFIHYLRKRVFLIVRNKTMRNLGVIEKMMQEKFLNDSIKIGAGVPLEEGLNYLCQQLGECIPPEDHPAMINLKRLSRPSNLFFVLTPDPVKGEEFKRMLKEYAQIMHVSSEKEFLSKYLSLAPNAVFIDSFFLKRSDRFLIAELKKSMILMRMLLG